MSCYIVIYLNLNLYIHIFIYFQYVLTVVLHKPQTLNQTTFFGCSLLPLEGFQAEGHERCKDDELQCRSRNDK